MKSITAIAGGIAFKIWVLALIVNTIGGSFMLAGLRADFMLYALFGGFLGALFSFPVFLFIWFILYHLFKKRYGYMEVFSGMLVSGIVLAVIAYGLFSLFFPMDKEGMSLLFLSIAAGCSGVIFSYSNIKKYCIKRDADEMDFSTIGQPESNYN